MAPANIYTERLNNSKEISYSFTNHFVYLQSFRFFRKKNYQSIRKFRIIALNTLYIYKALGYSKKFQSIRKKNNDKSLCKEKLNQSIYINISYPKTRNLYDKKRQWQILYVKKIAIKSSNIFLYLKANLITLYENRKHE